VILASGQLRLTARGESWLTKRLDINGAKH
jgi:hypothetical protein